MTKQELRNKLDLGDYGEEIDGYASTRYIASGYICDIFSEIADSNTSTYYDSIAKYIGTHIDEVNDTINELGWEGCGSDLYKAGQTAEYTSIQEDLEEHIDDIIVYAALLSKYDEDDIPEESFNEVYEYVANIDWNDRLDTTIEKALYAIDDEDEDEEEEDEE